MTRYKTIELNPRLLTVDLEKQLLPCRFAHAVHHLLEHDFDLSMLDTHYRNDETGASVQTGTPAVFFIRFSLPENRCPRLLLLRQHPRRPIAAEAG